LSLIEGILMVPGGQVGMLAKAFEVW